MTAQLIGAIILWLIVAIVAIAIIVYLVNWLYRRSSKEVSFVRTILTDAGLVEGQDYEFLPVGDGGLAAAAFLRDDVQSYAAAASDAAIIESLLRAHLIAGTAPHGPTYVCLDAGLQETKIDAIPAIPDPKRYRSPAVGEPSAKLVEEAAKLLVDARHPIILAGRVNRRRASGRVGK